uniref:Uncharacterized protein n=1 Tax=Strombidium inclinatum TaxID=197538 RepID=A0A7S3II69_9SPIT|mmetsp:Transcript_18697/g.28637  ORF Transcript_18697/g.28637 Transcript_18697/m.28637 type:complete len:185 (+) Transcript_18697:1004-1558(+)
MCLSICGNYLVSGDSTGLIYVWSTSEAKENPLISTYELHKDKGSITNLVPMLRPLSMFGLTANMKMYETAQVKPLLKHQEDYKGDSIDFQLRTINAREADRQKTDFSGFFAEKLEEREEDMFYSNCATSLLGGATGQPLQVPEVSDAKSASSKNTSKNKAGAGTSNESKRLKRTLADRFENVFN